MKKWCKCVTVKGSGVSLVCAWKIKMRVMEVGVGVIQGLLREERPG